MLRLLCDGVGPPVAVCRLSTIGAGSELIYFTPNESNLGRNAHALHIRLKFSLIPLEKQNIALLLL